MKTLKQLKEEIVNTVGSGQIAGLEPDIPPVPKGITTKNNLIRRKKFANTEVFVVSSDSFNKAKLGKQKFKHYASYVGRDEIGEAIKQYAQENKDAPIIIEDEKTGAMVYLRYGKR
jgi:sugar/nucleoside kinase (ribokinase family)